MIEGAGIQPKVPSVDDTASRRVYHYDRATRNSMGDTHQLDKKFADLKEIVARAMCAMVKGLEEYFQDARIIDVVRGRTF